MKTTFFPNLSPKELFSIWKTLNRKKSLSKIESRLYDGVTAALFYSVMVVRIDEKRTKNRVAK